MDLRKNLLIQAIENKLCITERLYQILVERLEEGRENRQPKNSIIDLDLRRMDIRLDEEKTQVILAEVKHLLEVFEIYRPDVNYVQGMSYLAWVLRSRLGPFPAFACFVNLVLGDPFVRTLYLFQESGIRKIVNFFEECVEDKKPKLWRHIKRLAV